MLRRVRAESCGDLTTAATAPGPPIRSTDRTGVVGRVDIDPQTLDPLVLICVRHGNGDESGLRSECHVSEIVRSGGQIGPLVREGRRPALRDRAEDALVSRLHERNPDDGDREAFRFPDFRGARHTPNPDRDQSQPPDQPFPRESPRSSAHDASPFGCPVPRTRKRNRPRVFYSTDQPYPKGIGSHTLPLGTRIANRSGEEARSPHGPARPVFCRFPRHTGHGEASKPPLFSSSSRIACSIPSGDIT